MEMNKKNKQKLT